MKNGDIIVIDSVRKLLDDKQQTVVGRIITDKAGNEIKVKKGQGGKLEDRWEWLDANAGKAIKLTVRDFKPPGKDTTYPFVADFEVVADEFVAQATAKVQGQAKDSREDSIEAQVAQKGGIEILKALIEQALLTDKEIQKCKEYAMSSVEWGMGRVALPSVIVEKIEEAKSETTKDNKATIQQEEGLGPESTGGEALELLPGESERVRGFLERLIEHNIQAPRLFLEVEYAIPQSAPLSDTQCELLYKTIKTKEKW